MNLSAARQLVTTAFIFAFGTCLSATVNADEKSTRALLVEIVHADGDDVRQQAALEGLALEGETIIGTFYEAYRSGNIFIKKVASSDSPQVLMKDNKDYTDLLTGESVTPADELIPSRAGRGLRKDLKRLVDLLDLSSPDFNKRIAAADLLGKSQNPDYLPELKMRLEKQTDEKVAKAFREAIYICELKSGTDAEKLAAVKALGEMKSLPAKGFLETVARDYADSTEPIAPALLESTRKAIRKIDDYQQIVQHIGTLFRGLSLGSVLLLVAYGLAITFGQMGVINMAHGEFIAIGGYTVYLIQNYFVNTFGVGSSAYEWYFILSLPCSFLAAALAGALLERGMIRFLYSRPLESLLATWGVSMILQQLFRLQFGAANVSVSSPEWLSGSFSFGGVSMSNSRILLVAFAFLVIIVTWLLMNRTSWGLHVRATMQNRQMASSLGVPSGRVNMLTFAYGSGLAGLAGAFISQIGNVGPSMGQTYIVDSFMVVVVGGVGNLFGAALSSLGIGMVDQWLQPILGPVMGKISVLITIILFLQFKPGGLFPSRSRSLDD